MTADQIIEGILGKEGGYVDHPSDKGGPTRWGITQTTARAHGYAGDMRNLPRETAKQILLSDYWTGPRFDQVASLSTLLADELCDTGVNMGPSVASKFFQRWLTAMNMRGKLYPDLIPDGAIGPRTITALKGYLSARGKEGEQVLLRALNCSQGARYLELAEGREANEDFLYGWVKERVL
ncbi:MULTISPECIES: glycoside hydrolase family 108 protein [Klebsiella pneumoniae complex]|uniref:glycoside hydrolase family 108 protein n=1 Tax=Klebsiella pneumoniae complex TaxID=3390273 RepID=UPI0012530BF4|nr:MULTISPECIES: putative peptidoglycan-binding domain-containing protein [Klebsiella]HBQ5721693.1 glycoside hydrolase family 108 protein [Klebsiella pneumoniae subsp. pneumoniae]HCI9295055.1 glycoside hydrolase family 108 protein [Klebsiella pneumoniae]HED2158567.1 glycoside hydrolase family 108 protein [Klebsiella variicola subsp. variicola]MEB6153429.1 glycoside hydrolase family 108 protein [Klebsiella quasipneumoniae]QIX69299.1 glycoside hydrolase family 108 protein [Klebsiella variicola]